MLCSRACHLDVLLNSFQLCVVEDSQYLTDGCLKMLTVSYCFVVM